jgi:hypothetical protein
MLKLSNVGPMFGGDGGIMSGSSRASVALSV